MNPWLRGKLAKIRRVDLHIHELEIKTFYCIFGVVCYAALLQLKLTDTIYPRTFRSVIKATSSFTGPDS